MVFFALNSSDTRHIVGGGYIKDREKGHFYEI